MAQRNKTFLKITTRSISYTTAGSIVGVVYADKNALAEAIRKGGNQTYDETQAAIESGSR